MILSKILSNRYLVLIFLVGTFLRFVLLGEFPVHLSIDEVAIAYDSYSIGLTGKDQWGQSFPLAFRSIGDYKAPLLIYLMSPIMAIFALTEFNTRFVIAAVGSASIIAVYLFVKEVTKKKPLAFLAAFSLSVSPWHLQFSRGTFEAVLGVFLVVCATTFFLKAAYGGRKLFFYVSAFLFALSLYAYHAQRLFVPLLVLSLAIIYKKELFAKVSSIVGPVIFGFIILLPLIPVMLSPAGQHRAQVTFITRDYELNRILHDSNDRLTGMQKVFDNNFLLTLDFWRERYLGYTDLNFLFRQGVKLTQPNVPDVGILHFIELPFFLVGAFLIWRGNLVDRKRKWLLFSWMILGPLGASLANNEQHALRSLTLIPIPQIFVAIGAWGVYKKVRNSYGKIALRVFLVGGYLYGILYWSNVYFVHFPVQFSEFWMDGWKQAAVYAGRESVNYEEVIVDPRFGSIGPETVGVPYLYFLFYNQIGPVEFQKDPRRLEKSDSVNFGKFTFRSIDWVEDQKLNNVLFVGSHWVLPAQEKHITGRFYLKNGTEILRAVGLP